MSTFEGSGPAGATEQRGDVHLDIFDMGGPLCTCPGTHNRQDDECPANGAHRSMTIFLDSLMPATCI